MKNEEAREILNILKEYERAYQYSKEEVVGALDMAIQALEQQPCEDCISREQAVYVASGYCAPQNIADELRKLPSVTPTNVFDKIINKIEQTRDKDKLCEYPYNRCIDIVKTVFEEHNE